MDLSALRRLAARRPHVLLVPAPGSEPLRRAVEAALDARRWPAAPSPADADVLLLLGRAGPRLAAATDAVWATVPAPRTRARVRRHAELGPALDAVAVALLARPEAAPDVDDAGAGVVMADLADTDRDGLALDALHVPLGPVLPGWPPGLVVHVVLAGDLVTAATAEVLDAGVARPGPGGVAPDVRRLDSLATLLALAGWDAAARRARALRDAEARDDAAVAAFGRRVARARLLGAMLRDVPLPTADRTVADRVRRWGRELGTDAPADPRPSPDTAAAALVGLELGAARLALAALDPDTAAGRPLSSAPGGSARRGRR